MANRLDVVAVRVVRIGPVVILVVLRTEAWCAIVAAAGPESRSEESVDGRAIGADERDVRRSRRPAADDPEIRLALHTEAGDALAGLHQQLIAERLQRRGVKSFARLVVRHVDGDVIDHLQRGLAERCDLAPFGEMGQRLRLDLTHALARQAELPADLL